MISIIVIGSNEEKNLRRCFNSIYDTISFIGIRDYEIIYVDSKSTDKSIAVAKEFKKVTIAILTGNCNAAIARNVGVKVSKGNILFFIDADMEINKEFIAAVVDKDGNMVHDFVSGQVLDIVNGIKIQRPSGQFLGGIFLIRREIWESVQGMRTKYKKGQDMDLGLRLFKKGFSLNRKKELITNHYTAHKMDKFKIWKMVWTKSSFYARAVLYRDHLFNKQMYRLLWKNDKTSLLLLLVIICCVLFPPYFLYFILIYLIAVIFRSIRQIKFLSLFECILYYIVWDTLNIYYLFTFYPRNEKEEFTVLKHE